jgi:hypothetical protein
LIPTRINVTIDQRFVGMVSANGNIQGVGDSWGGGQSSETEQNPATISMIAKLPGLAVNKSYRQS